MNATAFDAMVGLTALGIACKWVFLGLGAALVVAFATSTVRAALAD